MAKSNVVQFKHRQRCEDDVSLLAARRLAEMVLHRLDLIEGIRSMQKYGSAADDIVRSVQSTAEFRRVALSWKLWLSLQDSTEEELEQNLAVFLPAPIIAAARALFLDSSDTES